MTPGIDNNRSVASVIGGNEVSGAPGGQLSSVNPARTSEVVAEEANADRLARLVTWESADESFRLAD
jgi:hypothetical protein